MVGWWISGIVGWWISGIIRIIGMAGSVGWCCGMVLWND
jgi:hypothetical protein